MVNRLLGDFEPPTLRSVAACLVAARLTAALVAALGLAGCGRKGGLDAPPLAAAGDQQAAGQPGAAPAAGPDGKPVDPATQKRSRPLLDWLLN